MDIVKVRESLKKKKPKFTRTDGNIYTKLKESWRRPRGRHNKIRRRKKGAMPSPSYSSPVKAKGMHPCGLFEKLVSCVSELNDVDAKTHAVRIAASVGNKKKTAIVEKAKDLKLKVLNPAVKALEKKEKKKPASEEKKEKAEKATPAKEAKKEEKKPSEKKAETKKAPAKTKKESTKKEKK